jgi:hypothetical protein
MEERESEGCLKVYLRVVLPQGCGLIVEVASDGAFCANRR